MQNSLGSAEIIVILAIVVFVLFIVLIPTILYLVTLQKAFSRCRPENRTMQPGLVWLMLIPLFNLVWQFLVITNLSDSIKNEFDALGVKPNEAEPGKAIGLAMCILNVCGLIPYLGALTGLAGFVCWIIHWVNIAGYSGRLAALQTENNAGHL